MILRQLAGLLWNVFYLSSLLLATPWLFWRYLRYGKNRRGWAQKLWGLVPDPAKDAGGAATSLQSEPNRARKCIWLHAVSVGEVNLLAPIIERLQGELPGMRLVVSTTTETGYDLALKKYPALVVFFFPFDFTWSVRQALRRINPSLIVLAELEIWPNFIHGASHFPVAGNGTLRPGIPIAVVNGRLSEKSFRGYRRFRFLISSCFKRLSLVAAQDQVYADRFIRLGADPATVHVTGSVKFDGVCTDRNNDLTNRLRGLTDFKPHEFVWLAGSTQLEEDLLAAEIYQELWHQYPQLRLILAPRHPERCADLVARLESKGLELTRRSLLSPDHLMGQVARQGRSILLVDVLGELGGWWGIADAAYVGGSLGSRGGQNMIEPAAYGIPLSFGPHTQNFRAIVEQLLAVEGAVVIADKKELRAFVERCLNDRAWASQMGQRAQSMVSKHRGAADQTVQLLREQLQSP
jgi:3-deoxy-D-manno-octulosonic-acid transferase